MNALLVGLAVAIGARRLRTRRKPSRRSWATGAVEWLQHGTKTAFGEGSGVEFLPGRPAAARRAGRGRRAAVQAVPEDEPRGDRPDRTDSGPMPLVRPAHLQGGRRPPGHRRRVALAARPAQGVRHRRHDADDILAGQEVGLPASVRRLDDRRVGDPDEDVVQRRPRPLEPVRPVPAASSRPARPAGRCRGASAVPGSGRSPSPGPPRPSRRKDAPSTRTRKLSNP